MGRPEGRTNADFDAKRDALALRVLGALSEGEAGASMRELAAACEVTPPTLRHYFGDRDGAVRAALAMARRLGSEHLLRIATADLGARPPCPRRWPSTTSCAGGSTTGSDACTSSGCRSDSATPASAPPTSSEILEPTLQAFEARVALHVARGELEVADIRHATLALIGPLVLALLHQRELGGQRCRALDLRKLAAAQLADFLQLHAAAAPPRRRR
jgi:AcrR family transcriptional regulator